MNFKSFLLACSLVLLMGTGAFANNMLVQNVTTLGNDAMNRTIQVQFDISWDNSWRDAINYDAAWIFMKFKNASGVWQHAQLNQTGFVAGTGTANNVQVTADKVGSWLYRSGLGSGTFTSTGMQLQWNYGLAGLTSVTGLEVRVFAVEMVYVPEGEFNVAPGFYSAPTNASNPNCVFSAPGSNIAVVNGRLTPSLTYSVPGFSATLRIKGDVGIDTNNDGTVDNTSYPIGFRAFYNYKYELSEQQYADFLNTLSPAQVTALGVAGSGITLVNGQYFSSAPNKACGNSNAQRLFAYADWSGIRPLSILEINKASYGPIQPIYVDYFINIIRGYPAGGANSFGNFQQNSPLSNVGSFATESTNSRSSSGGSYYGILDLAGNAHEPVVALTDFSFTLQNGDGHLNTSGNTDIASWISSSILFYEQANARARSFTNILGFRFCRSAE
jgi:hypothetical protein